VELAFDAPDEPRAAAFMDAVIRGLGSEASTYLGADALWRVILQIVQPETFFSEGRVRALNELRALHCCGVRGWAFIPRIEGRRQ